MNNCHPSENHEAMSVPVVDWSKQAGVEFRTVDGGLIYFKPNGETLDVEILSADDTVIASTQMRANALHFLTDALTTWKGSKLATDGPLCTCD